MDSLVEHMTLETVERLLKLYADPAHPAFGSDTHQQLRRRRDALIEQERRSALKPASTALPLQWDAWQIQKLRANRNDEADGEHVAPRNAFNHLTPPLFLRSYHL